jgi:hypothetical protein
MASAKKTRTKSTPRKKTNSDAVSSTATLDEDDGDDAGRSTSMGLAVDEEVLEFIAALDRFKKEHNRNFPSWSEVLHVVKSLGYRR